MERVQCIDIPGLQWRRGALARVYFIQPRLELSAEPPFLPTRGTDGTVGFRLLKAAVELESRQPACDGAPSAILLPEFSLHPQEVDAALALMREAKPNSVLVAGIGHMDEAEARRHDASELWEGPSLGCYTNCAIVAASSGPGYLQPKSVPSVWEQDKHWRGNVIRVFRGEYVSFAVVVCSDLLAQPTDQGHASTLVDELTRKNIGLDLIVWLQHNVKPRSPHFTRSIETFRVGFPQCTVLVSATRGDRPSRIDNYSVSGAIVSSEVLPSECRFLVHDHHYVEPLGHSDLPMSRIVLLRYDADAYLVRTTLANSILPEHTTEKSALFSQSVPLVLGDDSSLSPSDEMAHIEDLCRQAGGRAAERFPECADLVPSLIEKLVGLRTAGFLGFLDRAILPLQDGTRFLHHAVDPHPGIDRDCRCWAHRDCIDFLTQEPSAAAFAQVVCYLVALQRQGIQGTASVAKCRERECRTRTGRSQRECLCAPSHRARCRFSSSLYFVGEKTFSSSCGLCRRWPGRTVSKAAIDDGLCGGAASYGGLERRCGHRT